MKPRPGLFSATKYSFIWKPHLRKKALKFFRHAEIEVQKDTRIIGSVNISPAAYDEYLNDVESKYELTIQKLNLLAKTSFFARALTLVLPKVFKQTIISILICP